MKTDYSCGVVPFRRLGNTVEYLLVQHQAGHWSFPKGHPEGDESAVETARRELAEETGIDQVTLIEKPAFTESYTFTKRSGKQVLKRVTYFLGEVNREAGVTVQAKEIADHQWADAATTRKKITFEEGRSLFDRVNAFFAEHLTDAA